MTEENKILPVGTLVNIKGFNHVTKITGFSGSGYRLETRPKNQSGCNCYYIYELEPVKP